jgi:hypothetical protein
MPYEVLQQNLPALCRAAAATLDDLREAVAMLEETTQTARRVLGGTHPGTTEIRACLRNARSALRAHETPPRGGA